MRSVRVDRAAAALALALLASCGGGTTGDVDPQSPAARTELVGTVTPGFDQVVDPGGGSGLDGSVVVSVRGAAGLMRTSESFGAGPEQQHRTGVAELDGPYMLRSPLVDGSALVSVATGPGRANLTPLTTLLVAQLLGQDPATAFGSYGSNAPELIERINDEGIAAAQAKVTAWLRDTLGVVPRPDGASFTEAEFSAEDGDAMFDSIVALNDALARQGMTLVDATKAVASEARLCLTERLAVAIDGRTFDFCPLSKSGVREEADPTVIAYAITASNGDALTLRVREDALLDARFARAGGSVSSCSGAGCTGITLGPLATNYSRSVVFAGARIGEARVDGTLALPVPGVVLPVLPCDNNKAWVVLPDRSVAAECVAADDPLGIGAVMGGALGYPRSGFKLGGLLQVYFEDGAVTGITLLQTYTDAATGQTVAFRCMGAECAGATPGPVTVNTDFGIELTIRDLVIEGLALKPVNLDGTPSTLDIEAPVEGRFTLMGYDDPSEVSPPPVDCSMGTDRFSAQPNYRPESYDICPIPDYTSTTDLGGGEITIGFMAAQAGTSNPIAEITVIDGAVDRIAFSGIAAEYACSGGCAGVTVAAPDGAGRRKVTFRNTVVREVGPVGLPGEHTLTFNGSFVAPAAP